MVRTMLNSFRRSSCEANLWLSVPVALFSALALLSCAASDSGRSTAPPLVPGADSTFLSFTSDSGDWVGQGQSKVYRYEDGVWVVQVDSTHDILHVGAIGGPNFAWFWDLYLAAPKGQALTTGTYEGATRYPFEAQGQPGLSFEGFGRGCNTLTGRFVVDSLLLASDSLVRYLHATFEQHCDGGTPALRGEVSVVANPWRSNYPTPAGTLRRWPSN